jgi:indolepyruvate ferredoxin oxidoreductase alpha subunit
MTGNQPTPGLDVLADGRKGKPVAIEDLVRGSGVKHLSVVDPYNLEEMTRAIRKADQACRSEGGGVSVVISRHPCVMNVGADQKQKSGRVEITEDCAGCQVCFQDFECPAISPDPETGLASIDQTLCSACGVCIQVCPQGAIRKND